MRWIPVLLLALLGALFVARVLTNSQPPLPAPPPELASHPSPIAITVDFSPNPPHSNPWDDIIIDKPQKIPFFVHYKNISDRTLLIASSSSWVPDIQFACNSWLTKPANVFFTVTGELTWLLVQPGETITTPCDFSSYLIFKTSGTYHVRYAINLEGDYSTRSTPSQFKPTRFNFEEGKKYFAGSFKAYTSGELNVPISAAQSSWNWK